MRKQELVYLHGLLVGIRDFYETRTGETVPTPAYDAMDVGPTSVHRGKAEHEAAVFALSAALAGGMGSRPRTLPTAE